MMSIYSRRRLLRLALSLGGLAVSLRAPAAPEAGQLMKRPIPATGELLGVVGLGTSDEFNRIPPEGTGPLREVLEILVELGGNVVDTAPGYGNSEAILGELIRQLKLSSDLFVATKVRTHGREADAKQLETSERLLAKRPLDLIQVHSLVDVHTQLVNLRRWKAEERIRYIGITHSRTSAFGELESLMRDEALDFVQLNYSILESEAEDRLLPLAADRGIAVMVNRPFLNGEMFRRTKDRPLPPWAGDFDCQSWAQFSLKYILAHPAVTCVIPATSNPRHMRDNMAAGAGRLPDEKALKRMRAVMRQL